MKCPVCFSECSTYKEPYVGRSVAWHYNYIDKPCETSGMLLVDVLYKPAVAVHKEVHTAPICASGKKLYMAEEEAAVAAMNTTRTNILRRTGKTAAREYKCNKCPGWHVTSSFTHYDLTRKAV